MTVLFTARADPELGFRGLWTGRVVLYGLERTRPVLVANLLFSDAGESTRASKRVPALAAPHRA